MQELSGQEVSVELLEGEDDNSLHPSRAPRAVVLSHNFVSGIGDSSGQMTRFSQLS